MSNPMKPTPQSAAYIGLVMAMASFGLALAAFSLALVGVR